MHLQVLLLVLLSLISFSSGCKSLNVPLQHVVMYDEEGKAVDPSGNMGHTHTPVVSYRQYDSAEYQAHLEGMFQEIKRSSGEGKRRVMLFIHGGLNTQVGSLQRLVDSFEDSKTRVDLIKEAGYYPIFVNWSSSLWSSYFEHLFRIRQGQRWSWYTGIPSSLVMFPVDLTRSLVRAPLAWGVQIHNDLQTVENFRNYFEPDLSDKVSAELLCRYNLGPDFKSCVDTIQFRKPPYCVPFTIEATPKPHMPPLRNPSKDTFQIAHGEDGRGCGEMNLRGLSYFVTLPAKLAIAPILDTFGTSAWINMKRRIHLLFHSEAEMISSAITDQASAENQLANIPASGGLSIFMQRFISEVKNDADHEWEVVLVGHSMGTIVINELIRNYGSRVGFDGAGLNITNIIFLAAASTITDYEGSILPYLETHPNTQFYNFMLHPIAERGEIQDGMLDLPPRGSLLVWLDQFLTTPETVRHLTLGRYENFLRAIHETPQMVRPRIKLRTYSAGIQESDTNPQSHSEMAERFRFWNPECWQVNAPLEKCVRK